MGKLKDRTGMRYGRLTVIERAEDSVYGDKRYTRWLCKCDCGNKKIISSVELNSGTQSCGCLQKEITSKAHYKHGDCIKNGKNGKTRLYGIWSNMKKRCRDKNDPLYGGRGIRMCEEWNDYLAFREWSLKNGYSDKLSIDRIDVNGNYEPSNCHWVSMKVQQNNRRNNRRIDFMGCTKTIAEWADYSGISQSVIHGRLKIGWTIPDAIMNPVRPYSKNHDHYDYEGRKICQ